MIDFIMANMPTIGSALIAIILIVWAIFTRQWYVLRSSALSLMLSAEKLLATKEGKEKFEEVYRELWNLVPKWLKKFVTEKTMRDKLQAWFDFAKDALGKTEVATT